MTSSVGKCHENKIGVLVCAWRRIGTQYRRKTIVLVITDGVDEDDGGVASRGGALALASLIHVPFFSRVVDGDMPVDPGGREPRKTFEIAPIDGFD